jgi:DNA polymerase III psi subunit
MNVDKLHGIVADVKQEIDRLVQVIEKPEDILGKFYNAYNENLLQHVLEYMNISEDELYNLLIEQLGKMPVLSNCKITKLKSGTSSPLLVSYRKPEFRLLKIDIKGKKFENVFETVVRGLQVTINETEVAVRKAEGDVAELKEVATRIYQLSNGDYALRGFAGLTRKRNIRNYLDSVNYTRDDIDRIIGNLSGFVGRLSDSIDKRQAVLAEAEVKHSEALDRRGEYDNNNFLQNAVSDLTALLSNSGYELKKDLSTTLREGKV